MIASLRGEVSGLTGSTCIVDVAGVGYAVSLTPHHARSLSVGSSVRFATTLIVREDSMQLFGFETTVEQQLFDALLTVSGVGPRSALAVLSHISPKELYVAVASEDDAVFKKVSGIGPKTAKLIVVSLAGKLSDFASLDDGTTSGMMSSSEDHNVTSHDVSSVVAALVGLGWPERQAIEAVTSVAAASPEAETAELLRQTLIWLGRASSASQNTRSASR